MQIFCVLIRCLMCNFPMRAVLAVLIILLLEVTTGQGVLTRWLTL